MRVATWNVNSIRARHDQVVAWLEHQRPDIVALQETRCNDLTFAALAAAYRHLGYDSAHHGSGPHGGVALLSRVGLDQIERGFPGVDVAPFNEPRILSAVCNGVRVFCVYAPSGRRYKHPQWYFKLNWLRLLTATVAGDSSTVLAGDFNVQPGPLDVYDPAAWKNRNHGSAEERTAITTLLDHGYRDVAREHHGDAAIYTWWSLQPGRFDADLGMRIDLVLCSLDLADFVEAVWIDRPTRLVERPSDHAPVIVEITSPQ